MVAWKFSSVMSTEYDVPPPADPAGAPGAPGSPGAPEAGDGAGAAGRLRAERSIAPGRLNGCCVMDPILGMPLGGDASAPGLARNRLSRAASACDTGAGRSNAMLHVSLLGERTVVDDATGEVRSRSSRTLALIAFLAARAGSPQPRARIAGTFWPSSPEQQALTNLRRELHQLRRTLEDDDSLEVTSTDLTWRDRDTCRVDLRVFERAREAALHAAPDDTATILERGGEALAAYRGELLPGLVDDAARRAGQWTVALQAARRRVDLAPLDEVGYRELIRLQAARGDRAGAVSTYHHCATVLQQELGIEPDPATRSLLADLVDRPSTPSATPRAGPVVASVDFVGRQEELASLTATMDQAF